MARIPFVLPGTRARDSHLLAGSLAVTIGVNVALQSRINGVLGDRLDDGFYAALISFGTGLVLGAILVASSAHARAGMGRTVAAVRNGGLRWFHLLGGLGGALYVSSQGVTVTALGVALFTVCIVAGQTGNSLLVDRLGLAPGGVRHITAPRIFASVLVVGAVVIGVSDRWEVDDFNVWFVIFAAAAGGAAAFQQAFNAQVARVADSVTVSSLVNFIVGFLALGLLVGVMHAVSGDGFPSLPNPFSDDWWLYLGGPMGVAYTLGLALVVRTLGVLVFGLCSIAGQLAGAVLLDLVVPTASGTVGWQIIVAVVLTFVAVVLAGRGTRTPPPLAAPAHAAE